MAELWWMCKCEEGELLIETTHSIRPTPPSRNYPGDRGELDWEVVKGCEICGNKEVPGTEIEEVNNALAQKLDEEDEAASEAAADRAYEEWKDRQLFGD